MLITFEKWLFQRGPDRDPARSAGFNVESVSCRRPGWGPDFGAETHLEGQYVAGVATTG